MDLEVNDRGKLLEHLAVAGLRSTQPLLDADLLGQLSAGGAKAPSVVQGGGGQVGKPTQLLDLGLLEDSAWLAGGHSEHADDLPVPTQRQAQRRLQLVLAASLPQPARPALVVTHRQRRAGLPRLTGQPLAAVEAAAGARSKTTNPVPHQQPLAL